MTKMLAPGASFFGPILGVHFGSFSRLGGRLGVINLFKICILHVPFVVSFSTSFLLIFGSMLDSILGFLGVIFAPSLT